MGWQASGAFTRLYSWVADASAGYDIMADRMDQDTTDITQGMAVCRVIDGAAAGVKAPTINLPMGGFKHTNVALATANTDYARFDQIMPAAGPSGPLTVPGLLTAAALTVNGASTLNGAVAVTGPITTGNTVQGENLRSIGDSYVGNNLYVTGNTSTANLNTTNLTASGTTNLQGLNVQTLAVYQYANITGNLGVGGQANVSGQANFASGVDVSGQVAGGGGAALYVNGTGYFSQDVNVGVGLHVSGPNSIFSQGLVVNAASGALVAMQVNGDLEVQGDAFANSWQINSAAVLKTDIRGFASGLAAVCALEPKTFAFEADHERRRRAGLIAEEVAAHLPEAVGNRGGFATLDPMALIAALINAVRELASK